MLFRKSQLRERCRSCSQFLHHHAQQKMGICIDCARKQIEDIKTNRRIRTIIGLLLASTFLTLIMSLTANNVDSILTILWVEEIALIALVLFLLPFARLIRLGSNGGYMDEDGFNEAGFVAIIEFAISAFTGPFFFIHGIIRMKKLSNYIKNHDDNKDLGG